MTHHQADPRLAAAQISNLDIGFNVDSTRELVDPVMAGDPIGLLISRYLFSKLSQNL